MVYRGLGCAGSNNTQADDKTGCVEDAAFSSPVRIVATDGDSKVWLDTGSPASIEVGDAVLISAASAGESKLKANTLYEIYDSTGALIESGFFHTSCSQPLTLTDGFGSLEAVGMVSEDGGVASLEFEVENTYTVTNNSIHDLTNVLAVDEDDNPITCTPGIPDTIPAGMTVTCSEIVTVSAATTYHIFVSGTITLSTGAEVVCEAFAWDSVTDPVPPDPVVVDVCETKVQGMLLLYTGPDISGATVRFVADKFESSPVIYSPIDLEGGTTSLSMPTENGFTIDVTAHGEDELGAKTRIFITDVHGTTVEEVIHTSCSTDFVLQAEAPLDDPKGDPSPNWFVAGFSQK